MRLRTALLPLALALVLSAACGFEGFLGLATESDHPTPDGGTGPEPLPAIVTGSVPATSIPALDPRDLRFTGGDGTVWQPALTVSGEGFSASFPAGERLVGLVIEARRGTVALRALVPEALPGASTQAGDFDGFDNLETAACLLLQAKASAAGRRLAGYPAASLQVALDDVLAGAGAGPLKAFFDCVRAVTACGDCNRGTAARFRDPQVTSTGLAIESALHPDFIADNPIDYDADGTPEDTTADFDAALAAALGEFEFKACYCDEEQYFAACGLTRPTIRVVFAADFNDGTVDGNCFPIDRFLWAEDKAGATMFFTGGVHPESSIQDEALEQMLGAWTPNRVPMFDDGTHGDDHAGDGIWSVAFDLPLGLRIGYKYTWGRAGDNWGGTEEWPGNRRILEIADVNGDHLVGRFDAFGDETSNKDKDNALLPSNGGRGTVSWDTDAGGDGALDAREVPADLDRDCTPEGFWTPVGALPLTTNCP